MLAISIVLFVVPDNSYLVMFQHYFTCRVSLFRNQNLNIQKNRRICRELKQISFFNSEGSPLLHPVALLIIKFQCENIVNYVQ